MLTTNVLTALADLTDGGNTTLHVHDIYLLAAGTRTLTGNWDTGNYGIISESLTLNKGGTDGGALYFDDVTTSFLKSTADGYTLNIGGFTLVSPTVTNTTSLGTATYRFKDLATAGAHFVGRIDASLVIAIESANNLRTLMLDHAADATEHTGGADTVSFASMPVAATSLATLITLVTYQLTSYTAHDTDAKAGSPTYHQAQYAGSDLVSTTAPTTLAEVLVDLLDIQSKYNAHDADATAHDAGSAHQDNTTIYEYGTEPTDYIIEVSDTAETMSIVLSTADVQDGRVIIFKDKSGLAGTNNITITPESGELIDGAGSFEIDANYESVTLVSDGANWSVI